MYPIVVLASVFGLAAYCASQMAICIALPRKSPYVSLAIGWFIGFFTTAAATLLPLVSMRSEIGDTVAYLLLNLSTYFALAFGYFNFVNLTIASLRIRLLEELNDAGGSISEAALLAEYNTENMMNTRFDRLLRGGHLLERDGRFFTGNRRFLFVARIYDLIRRLVFGRGWLAARSPT
jgi:hypothetical protein